MFHKEKSKCGRKKKFIIKIVTSSEEREDEQKAGSKYLQETFLMKDCYLMYTKKSVFFFFGCTHGMQKFLGQGLHLHHSSGPSHVVTMPDP